MISFARQDLILRPIEKRLYLFADERSEGENKCVLCVYCLLQVLVCKVMIRDNFAKCLSWSSQGVFIEHNYC